MAFVIKTLLKLKSDPTQTFASVDEFATAAGVTLDTTANARHTAPKSYELNADGFVVLTATYEDMYSWLDSQEERNSGLATTWATIELELVSRETI